eukprot:TRINITY_DN15770_c0_g1_i1.p2 TRINITY_DN15770_c0_g1~~TRINITY_DN15770_c0_g1_i1.p2  ORF type:complete len:195 (+),score=40.32 TRINITY_DN15770_c0_g1_i1:45-629(+)
MTDLPEESLDVRVETAIYTAVDVLDLQWVEMNDAAVVSLCKNLKLCGNSSLKKVLLGGCMLRDTGAINIVKSLMACPCRLEVLDLMFNQLTDACIGELTASLLTWGDNAPVYLGLAWNDITDASIPSILPLVKWTSKLATTRLSLSHCLLTQAAAVTIADELVTNNRMAEMNLAGNEGVARATIELINSRLVRK